MAVLKSNLSEFSGTFDYPEEGVIDILHKTLDSTFGDYNVLGVRFKLFYGPADNEEEIDLTPYGGSDHLVEEEDEITMFGETKPEREDMPPGRYRVVVEYYGDEEFEDLMFTRNGAFALLPPVEEPEVEVWVPEPWSEGNEKYLKLQVAGSSENWLISDISPYTPPSGYQYYYYVGNTKIHQSGKLTNFPWQSNEPVEVHVSFTKPSIPDLNYWLFPKQYGGSWGDANGGVTLDKADIGAYESIRFKKVS